MQGAQVLNKCHESRELTSCLFNNCKFSILGKGETTICSQLKIDLCSKQLSVKKEGHPNILIFSHLREIHVSTLRSNFIGLLPILLPLKIFQ